jgi:phosphoribosylanthranilate isomerase
MSKNKIWAADINNLSDARYFAAMGVDIMGFKCISDQDRIKILAIKEWVEGPQIALELDGIEFTEEMQKWIDDIQPDIVQMSPYLTIPNIGIPIFKTNIFPIVTNSSQQIIKIDIPLASNDLYEILSLNQQDIFIDGSLSKDELHEIIEKAPNLGIVIRGGNEEKPGIKSFDELDDFFDILSESNP